MGGACERMEQDLCLPPLGDSPSERAKHIHGSAARRDAGLSVGEIARAHGARVRAEHALSPASRRAANAWMCFARSDGESRRDGRHKPCSMRSHAPPIARSRA